MPMYNKTFEREMANETSKKKMKKCQQIIVNIGDEQLTEEIFKLTKSKCNVEQRNHAHAIFWRSGVGARVIALNQIDRHYFDI